MGAMGLAGAIGDTLGGAAAPVLAVMRRRLGTHRAVPQLYVDSRMLARAGFTPGSRFDVVADDAGSAIRLRVGQGGARGVSSKRRGERVLPVIDINSAQALAALSGLEHVTLVVTAGCIEVRAPAEVACARERLLRLLGKLAAGEALRVASLAHGAGIMAHAAHAGLADAGVACTLALANDADPEMIEHASAHNDAWRGATAAAAMGMQHLAMDRDALARIGPVEILEVGIPCSGASKAGRAKNKNALVETHPTFGHLVVALVQVVASLRPAVVQVECVRDYAGSASAQLLRACLRDMGYSVIEHVRSANDDGCIEDRRRWFLTATTAGLTVEGIDTPAVRCEGAARTVGDILDNVPVHEHAWSTAAHLVAKAARDAERGANFAMQLVRAEDATVPTLRRGYCKAGSTDPRLVHPHDARLSRLLTPTEHARAKGVPARLVGDAGATAAHAMLGQSVSYPSVRAIFAAIGRALRTAAERGRVAALETLHEQLAREERDDADVGAGARAAGRAAPAAGQGADALQLDLLSGLAA